MVQGAFKRFYEHAGTVCVAEGWQVVLDGKPLGTPMKNTLVLPGEALAQAVAQEWAGQGEQVVPSSMPFTQFSCAAVDYVRPYHADVVQEAMEYAATDALCYRAEAPEELARRQHTAWQPVINWAQVHFGIRMHLSNGIMPVPQPAETSSALQKRLESLALFPLTAVWLATKHCGSLLLALAVLHGRLAAPQAFTLSRLEETFQNERWGEDDEARARRESAAAEMEALGRFLSLISE